MSIRPPSVGPVRLQVVLVSEHSLDRAITYPIQLIINYVVVTQFLIVVVGISVRVSPQVTLIGNQIVARIDYAVVDPTDNLSLSYLRQRLLSVATGVEQPYASHQSLSSILGSVACHRRAVGVDLIGQQLDCLTQIRCDQTINLLNRCTRNVGILGSGAQGHRTENLSQLIVSHCTQEVSLTKVAITRLLSPFGYLIHSSQCLVSAVDQCIATLPQTRQTVQIILVHQEVSSTVTRIRQVTTKALITCQLCEVEHRRGFGRLEEQVGIDTRQDFIGLLLSEREVFAGLLGQDTSVKKVLATNHQQCGR